MNSDFIDYTPAVSYNSEEMQEASETFYKWAAKRRTVRHISNAPVPKKVIENLLLTAGSSSSGANKQPWTFCVVSNPELKARIREQAEAEEYKSYTERMTNEWLKDLEKLETNWKKPFLTEAPYIIIVFKRVYEIENGQQHHNYYVNESVGLACGMLLLAIHHAGLVTIPYTPSPMNFLQKILNRPENERPFLVFPLGYPQNGAQVPNIIKKTINEIACFYE